MAEPIQFFIEPESMNNVNQQAYLDYRDRLAKMRQKDISNPKKMAGMKKAVIENFGLEADEMEDILDEYNPKKIDPTDPKTWMKFDDGRVDIGRDLLVKDSVALAEETGIYRKQAQALGDETLGVIEGQVSSYPTRVLGQAGIDPSKTAVNNPVYRDNYNRTMSSIYQDVIDGIDPMDAFDSHLDTLGLPKEFGDHLFKQTESITEMMRSGTATGEAVPYPKVTQDVIDSFTDKPVYFPADDIPTPTSVNLEPTSRLRGTLASVATSTDLSTLSDEELAASKARVEKELMDLEVESKKTEETIAELKKRSGTGKPKPGSIIINADGTETIVKPDPVNPVMKADDLTKRSTTAATGLAPASGSSASMTSSVATTVSSGGAARVPAAVASTSPPAATAAARTAASVTAPTAARSTRSLMSNALEVGQKITRGHLGATALGVAAAGLLFGYTNRDDD